MRISKLVCFVGLQGDSTMEGCLTIAIPIANTDGLEWRFTLALTLRTPGSSKITSEARGQVGQWAVGCCYC